MWEKYGRWAWFLISSLREKTGYPWRWVRLLDPGTDDGNFGGSDSWGYEKQEVGQSSGVFQWRKLDKLCVKRFYNTPYGYETITVTSASIGWNVPRRLAVRSRSLSYGRRLPAQSTTTRLPVRLSLTSSGLRLRSLRRVLRR